MDINKLKEIANNIRIGIVEEVYSANSGHLGGALSIVEILTALYFKEMNVNVENSKMENRDRLVLSKGHASAALYSTLAEKGFFSKELLKTFRNINSNLQGHPDMNKVEGVDMTSGSLGQGLSVAAGMAKASKLAKNNYIVYCILGDGELAEGQIWEAAMSASHYKLDNLCLIVDNNNLQIDGEINKVMNSYPINKKFESFGFEVIEIDGHNIEQILKAFENAKKVQGKPTVIIAKTIKGKGVSFMENKASWHGKAVNKEEYEICIKELMAN